jgi:hypothetical protein
VTVEAVKRADRDDAIVVRVTEAWGARGRVRLSTGFPFTAVTRTDVLERDRAAVAHADGVVELDLRPFELVTLKFALAGTASLLHELGVAAGEAPGVAFAPEDVLVATDDLH